MPQLRYGSSRQPRMTPSSFSRRSTPSTAWPRASTPPSCGARVDAIRRNAEDVREVAPAGPRILVAPDQRGSHRPEKAGSRPVRTGERLQPIDEAHPRTPAVRAVSPRNRTGLYAARAIERRIERGGLARSTTRPFRPLSSHHGRGWCGRRRRRSASSSMAFRAPRVHRKSGSSRRPDYRPASCTCSLTACRAG